MVVDFCLPNPGQSLLEALQMWDNKTSKASADYSFHMAITWWDEQVWREMAEVVDRGITSFKHFMAYKGSLMVNDDEMFSSFQRCADLGALPLVHAENGDIVAAMTQKLLDAGNNGPEGHAYSRPPEVEGEATNRAIMIADMAGVPLYVVHVSCEQSHEAIRRARQKGMRVYGEPLIQHLTLDESEYFNPDWDYAARRVMSPPFRNKTASGFAVGRACSPARCRWWPPIIAPSPPSKSAAASAISPRFPMAPAGSRIACRCCGRSGVNTGRLTMNEFVAVTSTNIAKILNCYPKKGAILVGADADIVVWDPKRTKTISAKTQQSIIDYNVFEGFELTGLPRYVLSRGKVSIVENEVKAEPGHGKFVAREPKNPVNRALSQWKEIVAPRKIERSGIPATGV